MAHVTVIVTWNVQACRGVDGIVDPGRIARVIKSMAPADVICLQEIACNDPERQGDAPADQVEALADLFPEFEVHFGVAIDRAGEPDGTRWRFGNLILTRPPAVDRLQGRHSTRYGEVVRKRSARPCPSPPAISIAASPALARATNRTGNPAEKSPLARTRQPISLFSMIAQMR